MFSILIILLGCLVTQRVEGQCKEICPDGWIRFQDSCYYFGFGQSYSFVESAHFCEQHHARMIHVETSIESAFVKDFLKKTAAGSSWLGLADLDIKGIWRWYPSDRIADDFTDWYPGQPANNQEDCAVFVAPDYRWQDYPCTRTFHPVCEKSMNDEVPGVVG